MWARVLLHSYRLPHLTDVAGIELAERALDRGRQGVTRLNFGYVTPAMFLYISVAAGSSGRWGKASESGAESHGLSSSQVSILSYWRENCRCLKLRSFRKKKLPV